MSVEVDVSEARAFFDAMEAAAKGGFRKEMEAFLEGLGEEFLRIVEDEIIRRDVVDTRLLLISFHKGSDGNVWELSDGGLTLEVGSTLNYASYVNDGHWTNSKGVERRFVPGNWNGDRFEYDPNAKGGMVLKQKWVSGKPYFDSALRILEKMLPDLLDAKIQEWLDNYFG
ncbi:HK97 gp10 family phage protein [uncultured Ruminococcus sp.]|uniref:HK97 gp10 family phage protein n=1 Tax=uncultured Ruminococcus sp. TaxID=165186 RepID=UPI0025DF12C2|nr:HK97 gp10 family phage protein [uncultured Ruminococcus sp.]